MTVQQLIDLLEQQPDMDAPVVLRCVAEQKGDTAVRVVSQTDWREPGGYLTFIDYEGTQKLASTARGAAGHGSTGR